MHDDVLTRIREVEIELMDEVKRICDRHGLVYFLDSGTALGAVRHGGFIPWDDDVDLGMPRQDYEAFLGFAASELDDRFFLQTHATDREYYKFNAKLRKKNTFFEEAGSVKYAERGISIDIFPFDYVPESKRDRLRSLNKARARMRLIRFYENGGASGNPLKRLLHKLVTMRDLETMRAKYDRFCRRISKSPYVTCYSYRMIQRQDLFFKADDLFRVKPISFEGKTYSIMCGTDAYLTEMYGDYMQLPPEEQRIYHLQGKVLFGDE